MTTASKAQSAVGDGYLGRVLDGRYRLDEVIGAGATGRVYAARQLAVDRVVAIKLLHPSTRDRDLGTERFLREARAVARLSHASCLTLFDFGMDEALDCFYMVTEFVQGETLADFMARERPSRALAYSLLFQITTALEHAHTCGILHRDLKPENIMLVDAPESSPQAFAGIKVLDFGLARLREEAGGAASMAPGEQRAETEEEPGGLQVARLTHFGELNGTPAYMSPEQCRGELNLTPACDYYALGVLAYEIFEGALPFVANSIPRLLLEHLNAPVPRITALDVPHDVVDMVRRLLCKDAATRLQSSSEVLGILRGHMSLGHILGGGVVGSLSAPGLPVAASDPAHAVGQPGAQTLMDYTLSDTPIPRAGRARDSLPIELKTTVAADDAEVPVDAGQTEEISRAARMVRAALALLLLLGVSVGAWWLAAPRAVGSQAALQRAPSEEGHAADRSSPLTSHDLDGAPGSTHANSAREESAQGAAAAHAVSQDDMPRRADVEPPSDAPRESAAEPQKDRGPVRKRTQKGRSAEGSAQPQRPRKLELTY